MNVSPIENQILDALRQFLLAVLPATGGDGNAVDAVAGAPNRVAEPVGTDFVVMSPPRYHRLSTNVSTGQDCKFIGSIAAGVMTVSAVASGAIAAGAQVFGVGVAAPTTVLQQLTGPPGGAGTYSVSPSQSLGSETLSAGQRSVLQASEVVVQCDFHSATGNSGDMAQTATTLFRDPFAHDFFAGLAPPLNSVAPLYADDARFLPFFNESQQLEWRWVVELYLQVNQVVSVSEQFADSLVLQLVDVTAAFPP